MRSVRILPQGNFWILDGINKNELRKVLRETGYEEKEINEIIDLTKHALEQSYDTVERIALTASTPIISYIVFTCVADLSQSMWNIAFETAKETLKKEGMDDLLPRRKM